MEKLKVILVDDEDLALDVLTNLLSRSAIFIDIVAKCNDVVEAVKKIKELKPDVVFLDVQMPDYAGYENVSLIPGTNDFVSIDNVQPANNSSFTRVLLW